MKTPIRESQWPAEEPPMDFARRVTASWLRERSGGDGAFDGGWQVASEKRRRKRWSVIALAALSISATAWGTLQLGRDAPRQLDESGVGREPPVEARRSATPDLPAEPAPTVLPPTVPETAPPPAKPHPRPRRAVAPPPDPASPAPSSKVAPRAPLRVPRCECGPGGVVCSCVE